MTAPTPERVVISAEDTARAQAIAAKRGELVPELVEALRWAVPLAVRELEHHRCDRVKAGHTDISGTYKTGESWVGIYQHEVDAIERARTLLAKAEALS